MELQEAGSETLEHRGLVVFTDASVREEPPSHQHLDTFVMRSGS